MESWNIVEISESMLIRANAATCTAINWRKSLVTWTNSASTGTPEYNTKYLHCYKNYICKSKEYNKHNLIFMGGYIFTAQKITVQ